MTICELNASNIREEKFEKERRFRASRNITNPI